MDILNWCIDHGEEKRNYIWYGEEHYKINFESGDAYEYKRKELSHGEYQVTIWINGKMEKNAIYKDTWLDNGNYGTKLIENLPMTSAA